MLTGLTLTNIVFYKTYGFTTKYAFASPWFFTKSIGKKWFVQGICHPCFVEEISRGILLGIEISTSPTNLLQTVKKNHSLHDPNAANDTLKDFVQDVKRLSHKKLTKKKHTRYICGMFFFAIINACQINTHTHTHIFWGWPHHNLGGASVPSRVADGCKACNSLEFSPVRAMPRLLLPGIRWIYFHFWKFPRKYAPVEYRKSP